ncbi:hypothetical protein J7W19_05830 [Streptomyces mobaraensis NBRC 13819 = DSM 40847]|uniref:LPXTG-motif cell wall anchor domain-containing protein n=1 Tax=Streptomyces mobaraensis (strain ATCC 29032 / DSM 40847 / JCM 4168 / NBRC 13819 / NCIMB 11159 / IPCR 16-22) TaxID=1223523 RepID=M3A4T9_STRM1|nr:hypothetical protein [Streptomyces mobaraensis]EMF00094.1 hypothetical protein H340_13007 [Streptomyces mobaraensis NBRC 13819 = DSM 40847]QTT73008.1 hypothetical protein J7W19_05830 [Streptomyces mobaraensis NBRC 13819 = DSM 40847]
MRPARISLASTAAAVLALATAGPVLATPAPATPHTEITSAAPAPRGGDAEFVVTVEGPAPEGVDSIVVESPVFDAKITVPKKDFGHNKADDTTVPVRARVRCDARPGDHPVQVLLNGADEPAAATRLTVTGGRAGACAGGSPRPTASTASTGPAGAPTLGLRPGGREPQRGGEAVFTITTDRATLDAHDALTLRSPAFVTPVKRLSRNFKEGKADGWWTDLAGMVRCDVQPGTYAVDLVAGGGDEEEDSPLASVKLTVPQAMDPANRDFCAGPHAYKEIVDRTSETAPDEDGSGDGDHAAGGGEGGPGTGAIVGIASAAALVAASTTYVLVGRRRKRARKRPDESW